MTSPGSSSSYFYFLIRRSPFLTLRVHSHPAVPRRCHKLITSHWKKHVGTGRKNEFASNGDSKKIRYFFRTSALSVFETQPCSRTYLQYGGRVSGRLRDVVHRAGFPNPRLREVLLHRRARLGHGLRREKLEQKLCNGGGTLSVGLCCEEGRTEGRNNPSV